MSFSKQNTFDQNDPLISLIRSMLEAEGGLPHEADAPVEQGIDVEGAKLAQEKTSAEYKKNKANKDQLGGLVDPVAVNPSFEELQQNILPQSSSNLPITKL